MKTYRPFTFTLTVCLLVCLSGYATAQDTPATKAFQVALASPIQIYKPDVSISGFRLNLLLGINENVSGLDLGVANIANGELRGLQLGLYNQAGTSRGAQLGLMNTARESKSLQFGIFNHTEEMGGLQIGLLYNSADTMKGVQIGLLNFNWSEKPRFFFPIINGAF